MRHRGKTTSDHAEVGDLDPRADELTLFEGSGAAVPEDRKPQDPRGKLPVEAHAHEVRDSDRVVEGSHVPEKGEAVETF